MERVIIALSVITLLNVVFVIYMLFKMTDVEATARFNRVMTNLHTEVINGILGHLRSAEDRIEHLESNMEVTLEDTDGKDGDQDFD